MAITNPFARRCSVEDLLTPDSPRSAQADLVTAYAALHDIRLSIGSHGSSLGACVWHPAHPDRGWVTQYHEYHDALNFRYQYAFTWDRWVEKGLRMRYDRIYDIAFMLVCDKLLNHLSLDNLQQLTY